MVLLLELNGDLPDHFPQHERRLYIFSCPRRACNRKPGSVRVLRASRRFTAELGETKGKRDGGGGQAGNGEEEGKEEERPRQDLGAGLFGVNSLTTGSVALPKSNPFSSHTSSANTDNDHNPFASPSKKTISTTIKPKAPLLNQHPPSEHDTRLP